MSAKDDSMTGGEPAEENEVLREARLAKEARERAAQSAGKSAGASSGKGQGKGGIGWKTAAAAGLGSAAIVAALLYARRDKD